MPDRLAALGLHALRAVNRTDGASTPRRRLVEVVEERHATTGVERGPLTDAVPS